MKDWQSSDQMFLNAAEGWLGLNDLVSANEELEQISPALKAHPKVLELKLEIYWVVEKWEACFEIASTLVKMEPANAHAWIGRSFALHCLKRTQEAYDFLLPASDRFPKNWTLPYNLACYCSQLNRLDEAANWFKKAMTINEKTVQLEALADPDLKPLWDSMSGSLWRRS